jgi:FkbM family methyltransferase
MKKALKILFKYFRYYFWLSSFQRALLDSKNNKVGKILLFNKGFHYHYGLAFYDTFNEIFINNIYEFKSTSIRPVIIDCGANMGLSILFFSKQFPNAEIIAFEPDEVVLPFLEKNMICQNIRNVVIHKKAVWNEETELTFYTDSGLGGRVGIQFAEQIPKTVKTVRLQEFLKQPIAMLKMDIEGAEYIVLKDSEDFLINVKHIFIEYHSFYDEEQHLDDVLNILKRQGFRYHLRQSFSRNNPFVNTNLVCEKFDMAINVFAYKN